MEQLRKAIEETIKCVEATASLFYQQKNQEGFQALEPLINGIMTTVNHIQDYQLSGHKIIFEDQIFNTVLTAAMKAIEEKDTVLIADILIYEVNEMFQESINRL